jgi:hypothetical protein
MENKSTLRFGSTAAFLAALSMGAFLAGGILRPEAQNGSDVNTYLFSLAQNAMFSKLLFWGGALYGVFAIAVVITTSDLVRSENEGLVRWASILAIIGNAVTVTWYFALQALNPRLAFAYAAADQATRQAVALIGPLSLDPQFWMSYGLTGLWFLVMNRLANRGNHLPRGLTYIGMLAGLASWLVVAGSSLANGGLETAGFGLSSISLVIWYVWFGLTLRKSG